MRKPCCDKEGTNKGAWSKQEDQKLIEYIKAHGEGCWRSLPKAAGLQRCGKSCRLRWINYLRPDIKHGNFGQDEEDLIIKLHALLGNRWSLIAGRLPGRTDNEVKNYWNSHIRKKLIKMGIDPNNHRLHKHKINDDHHFKPVRTVSSPKKNETLIQYSLCQSSLVSKSDEECDDQKAATMNDPAAGSNIGSADLNLCLTIAFPSRDGLSVLVEKEVEMISHSNLVGSSSPSTLILFR